MITRGAFFCCIPTCSREEINAILSSCVAEFTCCAFSDLLKTVNPCVQDAVQIDK